MIMTTIWIRVLGYDNVTREWMDGMLKYWSGGFTTAHIYPLIYYHLPLPHFKHISTRPNSAFFTFYYKILYVIRDILVLVELSHEITITVLRYFGARPGHMALRKCHGPSSPTDLSIFFRSIFIPVMGFLSDNGGFLCAGVESFAA